MKTKPRASTNTRTQRTKTQTRRKTNNRRGWDMCDTETQHALCWDTYLDLCFVCQSSLRTIGTPSEQLLQCGKTNDTDAFMQ